MKEYKYIGTEEQLVARGFVRGNGCLIYDKSKKWDNFTRPTNNEDVELYIMMNTNYEPYLIDDRIIEDNYGNETDITPYIQDLIDDNLVEALS